MSEGRAAPAPRWLELVRAEYPLTGVTFVRDLGGNFNLNLHVSTDQGPVVVRVSPAWIEPDRLAAVQAVREFLRRRGWPIPETLRTRSGLQSAPLDGRLVEVEQYVEPRGTSMSTWPAISAGIKWLARLPASPRFAT